MTKRLFYEEWIKLEMTNEQQYWSLNGSFEALYTISKYIDSGRITSISELKSLLVNDMTTVNAQMSSIEEKN
ncbi:hypothetical protein D3C87_624230 [compost metagenome]